MSTTGFMNTFPAMGTAAETGSSVLKSFVSKYLVYIIAAVIVVIALAMATRSQIKWEEWIPEKAKKKIDYAKMDAASYKYWDPTKGIPHNGLLVLQADAPPNFRNDVYTLTVELNWLNTRTLQKNGPYRHILHRGSSELEPSSDSSPLGIFAKRQGNAQICGGSRYGPLPERGLPRTLNPGIFADPVTNDLIVFVDVMKGMRPVREEVRIPDIPLDIPFHLCVVLQQRYLEVYVNCRLEVTKVLQGDPVTAENNWYGLCGRAALMAQIQNLKLWKLPLTAYDIYDRCPAIKFGQRPMCNYEMEDQKKIEEGPVADDQSLGYGQSLSQCK